MTAQVLEEFVSALTWADSRRILQAHPELLSPEVDQLLARYVEQARALGRRDFERLFDQHRRLLARCRQVGVAEAFAQQHREPGGEDKLDALVLEIQRLQRTSGSVGHRIELSRRALALTSRDHDGELWATLHGELAVLATLSDGDRAANLEQAIAHYQAALEVITRAADPIRWALTQLGLAGAYAERAVGDRAANLEQAIAHYRATLEVQTRDAMPLEWARVQNDLGNAYHARVRGDRADNLERAIACYQASAEVHRRELFPLPWAVIQHNLGGAYKERVSGDRADNLERAIGHYRAALEVRTRETMPAEWAESQLVLGGAWFHRVRGDRADNLEHAIACYGAALQVHTRQARPLSWARIQMALGNAYVLRLDGDRADNLERAIACHRAALEVLGRDELPREWADIQNNLGLAYTNRVLGDRRDNLERSIACYQAALRVRTKTAAPRDWADSQNNLGNAYLMRLDGDRPENIERAIACYQAALQVRTRTALPLAWAPTQANLGNAYLARIEGEEAENIERAIACYQAALEVHTRQAMPLAWAGLQHMLGNAYKRRLHGDRQENLKQAIACYQAGLEVHPQQTSPRGRAELHYSLGVAYLDQVRDGLRPDPAPAIDRLQAALDYFDTHGPAVWRRDAAHVLADAYGIAGRWDEAARAACAAVEAAEELYDASQGWSSREAELDQMRGLHARAAFALANQGKPAQAAVMLERGRGRRLAEELARTPAGVHRPAELGDVAAAVEPGTPVAYLLTTTLGSRILLVHRPEGAASPLVESVAAAGGGLTSDELVALLLRIEGGAAAGYLPGQLGGRQELEAALAETLPVVGERLLGPLAERLRRLGATGVALVATGLLGVLPLHAAPYRVGGRRRCLLDEVEVSFAPSARVLATARAVAAGRSPGRPVLAGVGDPSLDLGYARAELAGVAAMFLDGPRLLVEQQATKERLIAILPGASHVHLACHGLYEPARPLASHLQLAAADRLTLGELFDRRGLGDARLVVASACQTGAIDFRHLPDEVVGLPAGFLYAGAAGVIGTLWSVSDLSTALVMMKFYALHLHGDPAAGEGPMPPPRALGRAQRWLREVTAGELAGLFDDDPAADPRSPAWRLPAEVAAEARARFGLADADSRPFAAPFHWAPFVLVGA